ncbi:MULTISPECIES: heme o synthase [Prochlorococcus]|uniref:Protoheme IX farnesyltransferase n=1 Tax=Prochlorococcus marinus (strain SARG / CCMP1375 / SS120) TaxID=167539 RepID=COXX_PROMA|nr:MULTISPECIES: heme o synthase [Prochlorococcus]Q7VDD5.1 RecName: Full=Protoheme IX farnesyltransferase; AltName: Full=Heme B farnesyltransferase; AltName: Full=Heme O synthase [Prochlorococcus marinus subsp. marinus str. CCMP1375]AAP99490.1 Polyprenyltransferase (cytochrome oxidase assembly factor) [Prochlorococcus marinus subsp. marinus str. CCMP1375]KGG11240.1 Heme O synthase [Prochlorococcus marinus str. LG]KGG21578.1 Heme O synthase [Prochlorococcus marinus str. SS2]KGG23080.1 Heme O sy
MVSSTSQIISTSPSRDDVVPSRKKVTLPPWLEVAKPRLIPLLLATTLGGMALSEGWPLPSPRLACTLGGGALAAAAAGALNCLWEQDLDGRMKRTSSRALPAGKLSPSAVFTGAISCTLAAAALLVSGVNCLAAGLSLLGLCSYVLLYTAFLKPRTSQNIVIGGVAGAIPPLVGAAAATGHIGLSGWWLFALVMVWTPAHFWALAILLKDDYRSVGIPMLPVVKGSVFTAKAIAQYGWATVLLSCFGVFALPEGGALYGILLVPFNVRLLQMVRRLAADPEDLQRAKGLFRWSILYMFGICLLLVVSRSTLADQFHNQAIYLFTNMGSVFSIA